MEACNRFELWKLHALSSKLLNHDFSPKQYKIPRPIDVISYEWQSIVYNVMKSIMKTATMFNTQQTVSGLLFNIHHLNYL